MPCAPLAIDFDPYQFACDAAWAGIPHFWNVVTNLAFIVVGVWGLHRMRRCRTLGRDAAFDWGGLWIFTVLVALGSGAYHWTLTRWGLAVDRVAICGLIGFIGAHAVKTTLDVRVGRLFSVVLVLLAESTVLLWWLGGGAYAYGVLQLGGGLAALYLYVRAGRAGRLAVSARPFYSFVALYALAKGFEVLDEPICTLTGFVGGHPLKHLVAAGGLACLLRLMADEAST